MPVAPWSRSVRLLGCIAATGPYRVPRYDLFPAAEVQGSTLPGVSSGYALTQMEKLAAQRLPPGIGYEWTDLAFQQRSSGDTALLIFGASVLFVFLVLAAQYESWTLPLSVVLIVPMCLLAAVTGLLFRGMNVDILAQIGFVVLVGLGGEERHPDRRVRQAGTGSRRYTRAGGDPVGAHPAAADPHDLVRLYPGRHSLGHSQWCRRRNASVTRHRGLLRHAGGYAVRIGLHPGLLRRDQTAVRSPSACAGGCGRRPWTGRASRISDATAHRT